MIDDISRHQAASQSNHPGQRTGDRDNTPGAQSAPAQTVDPARSRAASTVLLPFSDWNTRRYLALDVETTGLDARRDRIVEIGLLSFRLDEHARVVEETSYSTLIQPGILIPLAASRIHGIYDADLESSPHFGENVVTIATMMEGRCFVAHNAPFDMGFLRAEFTRAKSLLPAVPVLDSLVLARNAFPGERSYSLANLAQRLKIPVKNHHRALDDAGTCARIFARCIARLAGVETGS